MLDYIDGKIADLTPTEAVIDCMGIGFSILISLQTYESLKGKDKAKVYVHHYIREDDEQFYGFASKDERELFRLLISVSGIGVGSARMMLSSLTDEEIRNAILSEDVDKIKSVKGIGLKTAQRVILELKDKIVKGEGIAQLPFVAKMDNGAVEEATTALQMLGFSKASIGKVLQSILKGNPSMKVEDIIKAALQKL